MDDVGQSIFDALCSKYSEVFETLYPCPGDNGFTEANISTSLARIITKIPDFEDAVIWDEFYVFRGKEGKTKSGNVDSAIVSRKSKTILLFEAKYFESGLSKDKVAETALDMDRIVRIAFSPIIFPKRIWDEEHNKRLEDVENGYDDWRVYGFVCGGYWLDGKPDVVKAKANFYTALDRANPKLMAISEDCCDSRYIDVRLPGFDGIISHYLGGYFWVAKERGVSANSTIPIIPDDYSLLALLHEVCLITETDCKAGSKWWYFYPRAFIKLMPTGYGKTDKLSVWLDLKSVHLSIVVATKDNLVINPPLLTGSNRVWKEYRDSNGWQGVQIEIGLASEVDDGKRRQAIIKNALIAIKSLSEFVIN